MRIRVLFILCLCLVGCRGNSSSLDATASTSDQHVYYLKEFCSKGNKKIVLAETGIKEEEVLELQADGITFTPCPDKDIRIAYSNFTPEDVNEYREEYRSRNEKYNLLNNP